MALMNMHSEWMSIASSGLCINLLFYVNLRGSFNLHLGSSASSQTYLFTLEISTRDTSGQHGLGNLDKHYFQLENHVGYSKVVCAGRQLKGLWLELDIQSEVLVFNNGKYLTPPNHKVVMWSQKLLQMSSSQVWTVCAQICLAHGWKASKVRFGLCL